MSVRSCLLCGRALSRWNGAGDDFCSREHRNQYRLRKSMDRLQEANQVATVMRRREMPRPLKASRLINGGAQEPRAFLRNQAAPAPAAAVPQLAPACTPQMAAAGDAVAVDLTVNGRALHTVCPAPPPRRIAAPVPPKLRTEMPTPGPDPAPPVAPPEHGAAGTEMPPRAMAQSWPGGGRPVTNGILRRIETPRIHPLAEGECAAAFGPGAAAAAKGRTLKVSLAAGFRIPNWTMKPVAFAAPAGAGLVWPGPRRIEQTAFASAAELASMAMAEGLSAPELRIPVAPPPDFAGAFHWPGVVELPVHFVNPEAPHRAAFVPFTTTEEYPGKERPYEYRN